MFNKEIAALLNEIGDYLELDGSNPFRIRAFRRGAQTIESYSDDLSQLERKQLLAIPGIGQGIADIIEQYKTEKKVPELLKLKKKYPDGIMEVMNLPGLGAKRAAVLYKKLKIDGLDKLATAAKANKLTKLTGFGEKLQSSILKNMAFAKEASQRILLTEAQDQAIKLTNYLKTSPDLKKIEMAGSLRRWKETVGDLDFLCISQQPSKIMDHFMAYQKRDRILVSGKTKTSLVLKSGLQVDLRVVDERSFGAALLYFTGSKEHNVRLREIAQKKGLTLNEYGLYRISDKKQTKPVASRPEEEVYKKLGLPWIPPELREDRGEVEAGLKNKLPTLITEADVTGDVHNHTNLSDGKHDLETMVQAAQKKGWKWFASADHSPSLTVASGLSVSMLRKKQQKIKELNGSLKNFPLLLSSEVDILQKGKMDYPDEILSELDCVVASVHSRFNQSAEEMTQRICQALKNPHVDVLGHVTGRLLGKREAYAVHIEQILQTAKQTQTAVEINGQAQRQELEDYHVKRAIELGIPLILSTDAHSAQQLDNMTLAVHIARRGWAEKKDILNTLSIGKFTQWLRR